MTKIAFTYLSWIHVGELGSYVFFLAFSIILGMVQILCLVSFLFFSSLTRQIQIIFSLLLVLDDFSFNEMMSNAFSLFEF